MKIANEIKVGLLAVVAIGAFIFGYNFLKGNNIFSTNTFIYVEYDKVDGMTASAAVLVNGFKVGMVSDLYLKEDGSGKIIAQIALDKGVMIPKNAIANIISPDLLSGKAITLEYKDACNSENSCVMSGDTIKGQVKNMIQSMVGDIDVKEYTEKAKDMITGQIDSLKAKFGSVGGGDLDVNKALKDLTQTLSNLNSMTAKLDVLLAKSTDNFTKILGDTEKLTSNLVANNQKITDILANADKFTKDLTNLDLNKTLDSANGAMDDVKKLLSGAETTLADLNTLLAKLNEGEGTAAMIINDPTMYNNLNNATRDLDLLLKDFRLNPKRYIRLFRAKNKPYEGVEDDPEGVIELVPNSKKKKNN